MKRHPFVLSPLPVVFLIASLALPPQSAWALRAESVQQAGGLEELAVQLAAPFRAPLKSAGLEEKKPGGWFKHNPTHLAEKLLQALFDENRDGNFRYKTENSHGPLILNAAQLSRLMGGHPVSAHIRHDMKKKKYFDATLTGRVLWIVEDAFSNALEEEIPASTRSRLLALANMLKRERKFHGIQVRQARVISGRWTKERVVKALRAANRAGLSFEPYKVLGKEQSAAPKGRELKGAYKAVAQSGINQEEWHKSWGAALQSQKIPLPVNARTGQPLRTASRAETISIYADPKLDTKGLPAASAKPIKTGKIARIDNIWSLREVKKADEVVVAGLPLKERGSRAVFTVQTDDSNDVHFTTLSASEIPSGGVAVAAWINAQGDYHTVQRAVRMDTGNTLYPPSDFILIYLDPPLLKNGLVDQQAAMLYAAVGQISLELFDHPAVREATTVYAVGVRAVRKGKNNSWIFSVNNDRFHITPVGKTRKQNARLQVQLDSSIGDPVEALLIPPDPEKAKTVRKLYPREDETRLSVYPQPVLTDGGEIEDLGKSLPETFDPGQIQTIWKDGRLKGSDWVVISGVPMYKNSNGSWVFHSADKEYETDWQPNAKERKPPLLNLAFRMGDPNKRPQWARRSTGGAPLYPHGDQKQIFLDDPLTDGRISPDAVLFEARSDFTEKLLEHPAVASASRLAVTHYRTRTRNRGTSTMAWDPFSKKWITVGLPPKTEGSPYQLSVLFERQLPGRPFRLARVHELITGYKVYPRAKAARRSAPVETLAALEQVRNNNAPPQALIGSLRQVLETGHFKELGWDRDDVADFLTELNAAAPAQKRIRLVPFSGLLAEAKDAKLPPQHVLRWGLNHFADSTGLEEDIDSGFYEPLAEQFRDLFPNAFQDSESIWYRWDGREDPSYVAFQLLDGFRGRHMTGIAYRYVDGEPDVQLYLWLEGIPQGPWTVPAEHFSGDPSVRPQRDAALSEMKTKIETQLGEKRQGLVSQAAQFLYPQVLSQIRSGRLNLVKLEEEETSEIGRAVIRWLDLFQSIVGGSTESHGDPDSLIKLLISRAEEVISFLEQEVRDPMTRIELTHVMEQMSISGLLVRIAEDPAHSSNTALLERIFMLAQAVDTHSDFPGPADRIFDRWQASQNNGTAPGGEEATGLEELPAGQSYREGAERVRAAMQRLGVRTTLTPGEAWMLGQLADPAGHLVVGGLDQKFDEWLPVIGDPNSHKEWDVRYRMTIAARLSRELAVDQQNAPWRKESPVYTGRIGFVFSRSVITSPYFSQLRNGSIPIEMKDHLAPSQTLKDVLFLAQGDNSAVPRWKPAEAEMTVEEAVAAGAVGYKTSVMLPVQLDQSATSPYWTKLTDQNLAWVRERAKEARSAIGGLGVGYLAGAILWAAPPSDFVPPIESLAAIGQSLNRFREEMGKEQPAEWALDVLMKAWLASGRKKETEQSEAFSSAHAKLTRSVVGAWNRTPGITLIQAAGPYFVSAQEELNQRTVSAREAIGRLAELPGLKGKIVPATRNRPPAVFHEEFAWMADAGLAGAVPVGRSLLQSLIDGKTGKFQMMHAHVFGQGIARAAVDLLIGIDRLREKQAPGIWSAHRVTPAQAEQLIRTSRSASGLEEAEDLAPSQVEERLQEVMDGYEQVTVLLSGFPPSLLKKHSLGFALPVLGPNAILYRLQPLLQELGPSARLALEVDGGGAFTLVARFLPVQRSYPGNRSPRAIGSRLRRMAIVVLKDGAAFSTAFQEFLGPGSERKFFEKENPASPIDLKETEVRALLGMAENGEPTDRQKMLLAISPSLLNVVALSVEEADKGKDRQEVSPAPLNAQQVLETLERHPELRVETQIKAGPDQEPMTLDYRRIRRDEKLETMIGSFMDNALRLAGLSQAGLEEVKKLSLEQFLEQYQSVSDAQPAVRERLIHFTEKGADTVRVIQLNRPLTAHVHGKTLLADVERQRWPERLLRFVPWTLRGVEQEGWGFILRNEDVLGELPLNPKGLFVKPASPGHMPSAEQLVAEFYWNEFKIPMPELLLGQMIFSEGRQTYLVLFSA